MKRGTTEQLFAMTCADHQGACAEHGGGRPRQDGGAGEQGHQTKAGRRLLSSG